MNWECNKCSWLLFFRKVQLPSTEVLSGDCFFYSSRERGKNLRFECTCNMPLVFKPTVWKVWNLCFEIIKMELASKYLTAFLCPQCLVSKESLDIVVLLESLVTGRQEMRVSTCSLKAVLKSNRSLMLKADRYILVVYLILIFLLCQISLSSNLNICTLQFENTWQGQTHYDLKHWPYN